MRTVQTIIRKPADLHGQLAEAAAADPDLLLVFAAVEHFTAPGFADALRQAAPRAILLGCSTAGEIAADGVEDGSCVVTAVHFEQTRLVQAATRLGTMADSGAAGERLGEQLLAPDLKGVLLFGPGVAINGSALVDGLMRTVGAEVPLSGGLAGDGGAFRQTFTLGQNGVCDDEIVAVGLYGENVVLGHGSFGGWEPFGPARKVTRCDGNVLYELDGEPALAVYKRYLGDYAKDLPASGLLFPFAMLGEDHSALGLIRTILAVDEAAGSLTLAGEIQANGYLKLMHASTDKLVNGAETAAELAAPEIPESGLAVMVSCVGRKLVMGARVDEEVEAVGDVLGAGVSKTGFYSYGEISPFAPMAPCKLHNQTMTITLISER